jgi:hypothetical protein
LEPKIKDLLISLFKAHFGEEVNLFEPLPASGSYRQYARIKSMHHQVIGAYNKDVKENMAFFGFTVHFQNNNIPVPRIYSISEDQKSYLLEDLGNTTLFDFLSKLRETEGFSEKIVEEYKKVLRQLPRIQLVASPERAEITAAYPASRARSTTRKVSVKVPIWFIFTRTALSAPEPIPCSSRLGFVTKKSSPISRQRDPNRSVSCRHPSQSSSARGSSIERMG